MAWEISITAEGWGEIYDTLNTWSVADLAAALADDDAQALADSKDVGPYGLAGYERNRTTFYANLPQDCLADLAYERVEQHNTCDNGGNGFYIDREGFHKVYLP